MSLGDSPGDNLIKNRLREIQEDILDIYKFHDGYEFVPAIRSYNAEGKTRIPSYVYNLAGVGGFGIKAFFGRETEPDNVYIFNMAKILLVFDDRLYYADVKKKDTATRKKITPIMDDKSAYSWLCRNGGIGSINKFPVVKGSYQHKGWGLGWQCFPVSAIIYGEQVSFLRFNVNDGGKMRHHPHKVKHTAYLDPSLFSEPYYPDVITNCVQADNTIIAIRSIEKLRNKARLISDSFDVQRFDGDILEVEANGYKWVALSYKNAVLCIAPLLCFKAGSDAPIPGCINIEKKGSDIRLVQMLYNGELKTLFDDRISTGWVIHLIGRGMKTDKLKEHIKSFSIEENSIGDGYVPRMPRWNMHQIVVKKSGKSVVSFTHDPYQ
jgi:hypothetical protein